MQIDFHHAVTYVCARHAGFSHDEAGRIAYAAQQVDDAASEGAIEFDYGAMYTFISSAHPTLDPENLDNKKNRLVWLPFHFLPGNGGVSRAKDPSGKFIDKLVCLPGNASPVAQELVAAVIGSARTRNNALHALGIAMHVYADTWAHQGFAGVLHEINLVKSPKEKESGKQSWLDILRDLDDLEDKIILRLAPHIGHGNAGVLPDLPYLVWQYTNGRGVDVTRDNTADFCTAANEMCKAMQRFKSGDPAATVAGLPDAEKAKIRKLFSTLTDKDGRNRHRGWIEAIASGMFSFGKATITYDADAWRTSALHTRNASGYYAYSTEFLRSEWKLFSDALQQMRLTVLHDILPHYGICVG